MQGNLDIRMEKRKTTEKTTTGGSESPKKVYQKSEKIGYGNLLLLESASWVTCKLMQGPLLTKALW